MNNTVPKFWYLATPYSKYPEGRQAAYVAACEQSIFLAKHGIRIFSPIAHSHGMAEAASNLDPSSDNDIWEWLDAPFVQLATGMIWCALPGHAESSGMAKELTAFQAAYKPIVPMTPNIMPATLLDYRYTHEQLITNYQAIKDMLPPFGTNQLLGPASEVALFTS